MKRRVALALLVSYVLGLVVASALFWSCASRSLSPGSTDCQAPPESRSIIEWVARALGEKCPVLGRDITLRVQPIGEPYYGFTRVTDDGILILVESRLDLGWQLQVLAHEWAHAMLWSVSLEDQHDEMYGVAYSRTYRAMVEASASYSPQGESGTPGGGDPGVPPAEGVSPVPPGLVEDGREELRAVGVDVRGLRGHQYEAAGDAVDELRGVGVQRHHSD